MQEAKMVVEAGLKIAKKRREMKDRDKKKDTTN